MRRKMTETHLIKFMAFFLVVQVAATNPRLKTWEGEL
jgi:hypothetical protein